MTKIQIAYEVPADKVEEIREHLDEVAMRDPNWNGAEFDIERDEYTCIPDDSADAVRLFAQIQRIIDGAELSESKEK